MPGSVAQVCLNGSQYNICINESNISVALMCLNEALIGHCHLKPNSYIDSLYQNS